MNPKDFTYKLQNPQAITAQQTIDVKSIIDEFPYFQSARAIYLKGLKDQNSFKYNQELKTTAAYTADRSILFDFITSENFIQNEISQFIKQNDAHLKDIEVIVEDISVNKSVVIDDALKKHITDSTGVLDPALFQPKEVPVKKIADFSLDTSETIEDTNEEIPTSEISPKDILKLGKPLEFDRNEKHSFNEWLKLTRFKPIIRTPEPSSDEETSAEVDSDRAKKFELIDKFISKNPKINPKTPTNAKLNLAKAQNIKPEELMTETLARIYVEQKNYSKAIQSYKILSLKYPEKSSFFADQIKAVEELQENNNKE
ncbi:hypothetical protein KO566_04095 [Flavobacteriaceae bacterium XHP0103]|uniref:hypothetical protein n=1 Tax=Marixanthotalea marina TaxID=2844359 RepID=UPI002989A3EA|nr:hypothetical protein [Marixanthotalea marina]MBU3821232.1 hypothetical protein [Marixanthotalea marina]